MRKIVCLAGLCGLLGLLVPEVSVGQTRPPEEPVAPVAVPPRLNGASGAAEILHTWGEMLSRRDAGDRAEKYYRLALLLEPKESLAAARELFALGIIARRRGNIAAAETFLRQAHAIRERLAPGSLDFAASLGELAVFMALRGDVIAAEERFLQVLEVQRRLAPDSMDMARTLIYLGIIAQDRSDFGVAEAHQRRAIALLERHRSGGFDLDLARSVSCLGQCKMLRGDLAGAEENFRRALEIRQKLAPESLNVSGSLQNLGIVAEKRGELAAAEELHRHAFEIRERLVPGSPYVSESLANLGSIEREKGDLAKADELYRRAMEIEDRTSPERFAATQIRIERALLAVDRKDLTLAEELYGRALAWLDQRYPESLDMADVLEGLGWVAFERGDLQKAEDLLRRALAIRERMAPGSARLGMALNALGQIHRRAGRAALAAETFCRATKELDQQRKKLGGTKEGRSAFARETAEVYHDCLAALVETGRPEEAFRFLERGRARTFLDLLAERDLTWTADLTPELAREQKEAAAEYDRTQAALAHLSPVRSAEEVGRLTLRLRELRVQQEEIEAKIRQTSPRNAALRYPQPLDLAAVRQVLDPGTLLLAWSIGRDGSLLFAVLPQDAPGPGLEVFPLPVSDAALRQRVASFRGLLQQADSDRAALKAQARELYELLLRPAEARIAAADRILLSPDGPLHTLPFAALVRDGQWLAEQKPLHSVLSATVYAELRKSRRPQETGAVTIAAFGAPQYPRMSRTPRRPRDPADATLPPDDPDVRTAAGRGLSLAPLPVSREEVRDIAELFPQTKMFLGADATEEQAKNLGNEVRYIHFACHGLLDERSPMNSALALTIPESPREGEDNGLLQAWEIFESVRLDADLVTLSACDSALGSEMGGEGLLGLTRAFQYAGARSVLATLWGVSDVSTAHLMKRFYGELRAGQTKDEALRSAQAAAIRSARYSHPYYWAAFQLTGGWK